MNNIFEDFNNALRTGQINQIIGQIVAIIALLTALGGVLPAGTGGSSAGQPPANPGAITPSPTPNPSPNPTPNPDPAPANAVRLVDQERVNRARMATGTPVALNGRVYEYSLAARPFIGNSGYAEYNLSREFNQLTATVGIDDNARIAEQYAIVKFYVDGTLVREVLAELGKPKDVTVPLNQGLRLRVESSTYRLDNTTMSSGDSAVIGTPMLHR